MSSKVHVDKPLSSRLIIELLNDNPDLEEIECPQSLYDRTSETYIDALNELEITISVIENRGRPKKYDDSLKEKIDELLESGFNPKAIANRLHINVKTVYYLKNKKLKQGPKSKYSDETKKEIIKMKNEGTSVKNISSALDIPVRTVYYILEQNKKNKQEGV
jgi:hypothetical protein